MSNDQRPGRTEAQRGIQAAHSRRRHVSGSMPDQEVNKGTVLSLTSRYPRSID